MLRVAVLDDEKSHLQITCKLIKQYLFDEYMVYPFETEDEFENAFNKENTVFDIVVLDICLPESNGIEVAKHIRTVNDRCRIIYLTNYLEFATEVYETDHTFFVLKTDVAKKLPVAIKKAKEQLENYKKESICIKVLHGNQKVICFEDVVCVERVKRKTIITTVSGEEETLENISEIFGTLEQRLIRCHRSFWANPAHIKDVSSSELFFRNGRSIPLSRGYSKEMKIQFMHYIISDR